MNDIGIGLEELWQGLPSKELPSVPKLIELAKEVCTLRMKVQRKYADLKEQEDVGVATAAQGRLVRYFRKEHHELLELIKLSKTFGKYEDICRMVFGVLHHPSVTFDVLPLLSAGLQMTQEQRMKKGMLWDMLSEAVKWDSASINALTTVVNFLSVGTIISLLHHDTPLLIVQICELIDSSAISIERFVFEGWIVPHFVSIGKYGTARQLSSLGSLFYEERQEHSLLYEDREDHSLCILAVRNWMDVIRSRYYQAKTDNSTDFEFGLNVIFSSSGLNQLISISQSYTNSGFEFKSIIDDIAVVPRYHKHVSVCLTDEDPVKFVENICDSVKYASNLIRRTEEALARESLLNASLVAKQIREMELETLGQELFSHRGLLQRVARFQKSLQSFIDQQNMNVPETDLLIDETFRTMMRPIMINEFRYQKGILKKSGYRQYQLSTDHMFVSITDIPTDRKSVIIADLGNERLSVALITEAKMGFGILNPGHHDDITGCFFYYKLNQDIVVQLAASLEEDALSWVFGLQHLSAACDRLDKNTFVSKRLSFRKFRHSIQN